MAANQVFRVYDDADTMLRIYNRRLTAADSQFKKRKPEIERFQERYRNEPTEAQITDEGHRVSVTQGIGIIDTMFSSMTAVDIEFLTKAIGKGTPEQAVAATWALNTEWRNTKGGKRIKKAVKDALIADTGWVKVYYDYVEGYDVRDRPKEALEAEVAEMRGQGMSDEDITAELKLVESVEVVLRDRVCVQHVPWNLIRYDTTANDICDLRWVAQYTLLPLEEVRQHPTWLAFVYDRYGKQRGKQLLADLTCDTSAADLNTNDINHLNSWGEKTYDDEKRVTVVEMWDFETGLVTTFPKGNTELALYQRTNPLMFNVEMEDRNPFKPLQVRDVPDQFEGMGDMRAIKPSLDELDEYRRNMAEHVSRTVPMLMGPARAMTEQGKKAFKSGEWGAYVSLEENVDAGNRPTPITPPPLTQEMYSIPERIEAEMKEATGANEVLRGVFPTRRVSATESNLVADAGERRQAERRSAMEDWLEAIATTMLQLMQKFYTADRMMRFTNDLGQEFTWAWNNEDIALDADIRVGITPKENMTRAELFNRWTAVMNLALPQPETDRGELMKQVYRVLGLTEAEITAIVKSPEEMKAQQAADELRQLSVAPQAGAPGLSIRGPQGFGGGGGPPARKAAG